MRLFLRPQIALLTVFGYGRVRSRRRPIAFMYAAYSSVACVIPLFMFIRTLSYFRPGVVFNVQLAMLIATGIWWLQAFFLAVQIVVFQIKGQDRKSVV